MEKFPIRQPANDNRKLVERLSVDDRKSLEALFTDLDALCDTYRNLREKMKAFSHIPGTTPHPVNTEALYELATECHSLEYAIGGILMAISAHDEGRANLIMDELRDQGVEWLT